MKKNLLWTLLAIGITASALGIFYSYKLNFSLRNNQASENQLRETSETLEKASPTNVRKANLWRLMAWKDKNGKIPPNAISEALKQRDEYLEKQKEKEKPPREAARLNQVSSEPSGVARMNWSPRGPQNVGGRTRAIIVHPSDRNIIWAGASTGGVWKSTNGGTTWSAMNGNLQNYAISSMAIDPSNPNILYAGTGGDIQGGGIFKTTDGGMTWRHLAGTAPVSGTAWVWSAVHWLSINPTNSNIILAGTNGGIMRSETAGEPTGNQWTNVYPTDESKCVIFSPNDGNKAVAEIRSSIFRRTVYSTDGGISWQHAGLNTGNFPIEHSPSHIEMAYSQSNPSIVYALFIKTIIPTSR